MPSRVFTMATSHRDLEEEPNHPQAAAVAPALPWPDLPKELWMSIAGRLDTCIDSLRFRSVCTSWRSLSIPNNSDQPEFPLIVPSFTSWNASAPTSLVRFIVYRLEPYHERPSTQGWLVKVDERHPGSARLICPVSKRPSRYKPAHFPKSVNFTEFRVSEVCREYAIRTIQTIASPIWAKVVFHLDSPRCDLRSCVAFAVMREGGLRCWRYGDNHWKAPNGEGTCKETAYDDVIIWDKQVYVVDRLGTVHWIDPCHHAVQFTPSMCGGGQKKHLVEFGGDLYVVDRYEEDFNCVSRQHPERCCYTTINLRIYRLDHEWGKWEEMNELRGMVVFIGELSSFCVSVEQGENRIYFTWRSRCNLFEGKVFVFDLVDRSIKRLVSVPDCWTTLWPVF